MFFRSDVVKQQKFDERLGVGAGTIWGAAEDIDYPLSLLCKGYEIYYDFNINVYHPEPVCDYDASVRKRAYRYGAGMGFVLKKYNYPFWYILYQLFRPLSGSFMFFLLGTKTRAKYHLSVFKGRLKGCMTYENC